MVQATGLIVGLLLVRMLPVEQYALYAITAAMLALVNMISTLALPHALISLGASRLGDRSYLGALHRAAENYGHRLFILAVLTVAILSFFSLRGHEWSLPERIACVMLVLSAGLAQIRITLSRAIFTAHQNARAIVGADAAVGFTRLALVASCLIWPFAAMALAVNFLGAVMGALVSSRSLPRFLDRNAPAEPVHREELKRFVVPLAPIVIYTAIQGQISIFLLSVYGDVQFVAELGALSRLGQLFVLPTLLIPFLIQPYFARLSSRREFLKRTKQVLLALSILSAGVLVSSFMAPDLWLAILGRQYANLIQELPLAIGVSLVTLAGATLYTIVISRKDTRFQSLAIIPSLGGLIAFVIFHDVDSTGNALLLNLVPAVGYSAAQAALLTLHLMKWPKAD